MKSKHIVIIAWIFAILLAGNCKKGGSGPEQTLVVETVPASLGQLEAPAPGPNFPLKVTINSSMPPKGVTIDVTARVDGGAATFFTRTANTTATVTDFSITGTPKGVIDIVEITVTSNSTATNKWTGNFKYSMK